MKDDRFYLVHITECVGRVVDYTKDGKGFFLSDTKTQDAVIRNLQIMAESSQRVSDALKSKHPLLDWRGLSGFRNVLVHGYFGVDLARIWEIIENQIPHIKRQVENMLEELDTAP